MAELTSKSSPDSIFGTKAGSKSCKLPSKESTGTSPLNPNAPFENLIYVRYLDHVNYNRTSALLMGPQIREAVGWLVYDCDLYIILSWDRDAGPPTLKGGDPKASGLVLLKSDIQRLVTFFPEPLPLQKTSNWHLNRKQPIQEDEYAFRPSERKTHRAKDSTRRQQV
jgi:hypothetical protein